jgi:hypothetical protein
MHGELFHDWSITILALALAIGWLSNFTVFFRLPTLVAYMSVIAPWILFVAMIFLSNGAGPDLHLLAFIPFYPWAFGIALIHLSRLQILWPNSSQTDG